MDEEPIDQVLNLSLKLPLSLRRPPSVLTQCNEEELGSPIRSEEGEKPQAK